MSERLPLILPVENQTREFDAKLLLSAVAAERGIPAFVGCHAQIGGGMHRFPRGIYFGKAVSPGSLRLFDIVKQLGHGLVAWDEEALVYQSRDTYLRRKTAPQTIAATGALFAWGEDNAENWRTSPGYRGQPLFTTGNPRADLLRTDVRGFFDGQAAALRQQYGDFVLINSNFAGTNLFYTAVSQRRLDLLAKLGPVDVEEAKRGTWDDPKMIAYRHAMFAAFRELVPQLARRLPHLTIVVRPHPSENEEPWRQAAAGLPNVRVVFEGSVIPWLIAARATIQNGCTTAVESFLLDRPAIAYAPIADPFYDMPLPNDLSETATSVDGVVQAIENGVAADPDRDRLAGRYVASRAGPLAADRIVDAVRAMHDDGQFRDRRGWRDRVDGQIASRKRGIKKRINRSKKDSFDNAEYISYRFPDLSVAAVEDRLQRLRAATGRFDRVRVEGFFKNVFALTAEV